MLVYYEFRSSIQVRFFFKNISKIYFSTNNKQLVMLRIFYIFKKVLTSIKMLNEILRHKRTHLNFQCFLLPVTYLLCASWHTRLPKSSFKFLCWLQQSLPHPIIAIPHRSSLSLSTVLCLVVLDLPLFFLPSCVHDRATLVLLLFSVLS